jgi:glutamyl-tRNA synthetase
VEDLASRIKPFIEAAGYQSDERFLQKVAPLIQPRLVTLDEAPEWIGFLFKDHVEPEVEQLIPKGLDLQQSAGVAHRSLAILEDIEQIDHELLEERFRALVEELGLKAGQVFGILRVAITGQKVSPPLFESMEIVGINKVRERVKNALAKLENSI